jgi:hypothetical protein
MTMISTLADILSDGIRTLDDTGVEAGFRCAALAPMVSTSPWASPAPAVAV